MAELKPQSETLDSESSVPPIVQHGLLGGGGGVTPHQHLPGVGAPESQAGTL